MTRLDDDEALILAQARAGLGPTSADEQRVLQRVRAQITLAPISPSRGTPLASPWPLRIAASIAVIGAVALSGGLGYHQGFEAGIAQKNKPDRLMNTVVSGSPTADARPASVATKEPIAAAEHAPSTTSERRPEHDAKSLSAASAPRGSSAAPAPAASAAPLGLDEEVRQLRRVERAIREGNPRLALALVDEMDQAMPAGQLLEERRAAGIMANCQLGSAGAVNNARAFAAKHSGSAYLTRVIEICELTNERNSAAPGTNTSRSGG